MEKNQEIEDYKVSVGLLGKQLSDLPEAVRKRDEDLNRYKQAMESRKASSARWRAKESFPDRFGTQDLQP